MKYLFLFLLQSLKRINERKLSWHKSDKRLRRFLKKMIIICGMKLKYYSFYGIYKLSVASNLYKSYNAAIVFRLSLQWVWIEISKISLLPILQTIISFYARGQEIWHFTPKSARMTYVKTVFVATLSVLHNCLRKYEFLNAWTSNEQRWTFSLKISNWIFEREVKILFSTERNWNDYEYDEVSSKDMNEELY